MQLHASACFTRTHGADRRVPRWVVLVLAAPVIVVVGLALGAAPQSSGPTEPRGTGATLPAATGPTAPRFPSAVCDQAILNSPYNYTGPAGTYTTSGAQPGLPTFGSPNSDFPTMTKVVVITPGDNKVAGESGDYEGTNTIYYFAPGTHLMDGFYAGNHSVYIGGYDSQAGKAVLDGVDGGAGINGKGGSYVAVSKPAGGNNTYNTWMYLTIQNYASSLDNAVLGNVNGGGSGVGDTYKYNTIGPNQYGWRGDDEGPARGQSAGGGYAINFSDHVTIEHNCITRNSQGGFNGSGVGINISNNEISWNGLGVYPDTQGPGGSPHSCGCSGGGKLNFSTNATLRHNYVHDNYNAGIWLDFNNAGADVSFNYVESNWASGIFYEASYNARITYNTLVGNGWASHGAWPSGIGGKPCFEGVSCTNGDGPITGAGGGFPYAAIYLANSGGNPNIKGVKDEAGRAHASRFPGRIVVQGNVLTNNFGGIGVYTDTDRFPDGVNNNSACSVPLNAGDPSYYRQTKYLTGGPAAIAGTSVAVSGGLKTLCSHYESGSQENGFEERVPKVPAVGMAVYDLEGGTFLGNVASAASAGSFTLDRPPPAAEDVTLLVSAYGGCGPASYFGSGPGVRTGAPSLPYWDNCIWGSRNITVTGNTFTMQADHVMGCSVSNLCGYMQAVAFNAGVPKLMQYFQTYPGLVAKAVGGLGNAWSNNSYSWSGGGPGEWQFGAGEQSNRVSRAEWTAPPYDQDVGSYFGAGSLPTTPQE